MESKEDAQWEQRPYEPSKRELLEMDSLRAQAEQEMNERKRKPLCQSQ